MEEVDLGVSRGQRFPGDPDRIAIVLPGAGYVPAAPLLWFAREGLQADGWTVLQVWDEWDRQEDAHRWVTDRFDAALEHAGPARTRLVVAKSLTTLAIPAAVEQGLPGAWLTPLLDEKELREALETAKVANLLIGSTGDPTWDTDLVHRLPAVEALEIEGTDHAMQYPRDPRSSIDALMVITERIRRFAEGIA